MIIKRDNYMRILSKIVDFLRKAFGWFVEIQVFILSMLFVSVATA